MRSPWCNPLGQTSHVNPSPFTKEGKAGGRSHVDLPRSSRSARRALATSPRSAASPPRTPGPARRRGRAPAGAGTGPFTAFGGAPIAQDHTPAATTDAAKAGSRASPQAPGAAGILRNLQFSYSVRVTAR